MNSIILIAITVVSRLLPHLPNMTLVGSMGLFTGSRDPFAKAAAILGMSLFISDALLGFHNLMWATYGSIGLGIALGRILGRTPTWKRIISVSALSSVQFFLITNAAVWVTTPWYPKTADGLLACYVAALPFFRNSLLGDLAFAGILFGVSGFRWTDYYRKARTFFPVHPAFLWKRYFHKSI